MNMAVVFVICLALVTIPLLAIGVLLIVGVFAPEVRKKGLRQLRQPFALQQSSLSEFALHKQRRSLEDEVIRRYGRPDVDGEERN